MNEKQYYTNMYTLFLRLCFTTTWELKLMTQNIEGCLPYIFVSTGYSICSICYPPSPQKKSIHYIESCAYGNSHHPCHKIQDYICLWRTPTFFRTTKLTTEKIFLFQYIPFPTYICHFYSSRRWGESFFVLGRLVKLKTIFRTKHETHASLQQIVINSN